MSSMLTPYEPSPKASATTSPQTQPLQQHPPPQAPISNSTERIPTYAESNISPLPTLQSTDPHVASSTSQPASASTSALPTDLPPAYTPLDANQTTFSIHGPFIHTPAGPAYHLSSPLYTRGSPLRIRRLSPREVGVLQTRTQTQIQLSTNRSDDAHPIISFQKSDTLYELFAPAFLGHEIQVRGKRGSCLGGVLIVHCKSDLKLHGSQFGLLDSCKAKVVQNHAPSSSSSSFSSSSSSGSEILSSKRKRVQRGSHGYGYGSEWKDGSGKVLATDYLHAGARNDGSGVVPVIELSRELDQTWREAVLSVWVARLWWAFSREKSAVLGV